MGSSFIKAVVSSALFASLGFVLAFVPGLAHAATDVNVSTESGVMHVQIDGDKYDAGRIAQFVAKNPTLKKYIKCQMSYDYDPEGTIVCNLAISAMGDLAIPRTPGQ